MPYFWNLLHTGHGDAFDEALLHEEEHDEQWQCRNKRSCHYHAVWCH